MTPQERLKARRDLMSSILAQSKAGEFDSASRKQAQEQAADLGVSEKAFGLALQRNNVESSSTVNPNARPVGQSGSSTVNPNARPVGQSGVATKGGDAQAEQTQNVMFQKEFGSGLAALSAMQSPDYVLGSGSSLRKPARQIGTASGDMNRAARRLRRQGYTSEASRMAGQAEMQRLTEPRIATQADRELDMAINIQQGKMAMEDEAYKRRMMDLTEQLLRKRLEETF